MEIFNTGSIANSTVLDPKITKKNFLRQELSYLMIILIL